MHPKQLRFIDEQEAFLIRFWGVRGSYPTPDPLMLRHGGNTSCIEVQLGEHILILDAGSGIIRLGNDLVRRLSGNLDICLLFTHGHSDHLSGFPFFAPLFESRVTLHFIGPWLAGKTIEQLITPLMSPPYFPINLHELPSTCTFHTISSGERIVWECGQNNPKFNSTDEHLRQNEVRISMKHMVNHGSDGIMIYRIEYAKHSLVYSTDIEWGDQYDPAYINFIYGTDLLIHDAQYMSDDYKKSKRGFGHSTIEMATGIAQAARVGELILFHHDPLYNDDRLDWMEAEARKQFVSTRSAYEGMEIDLLTNGAVRGLQ